LVATGFLPDFKMNIVKSQCCYQTIKEQCIYNSLSYHEWWPQLPSNMTIAASQTWKLVAKQFQRRRFFRNHPIRNKNYLWWPYLLTDRDEMSKHNRGLSIDASYQVSVHLAKRYIILFQTMNDDPDCHQTWQLPLLKLEN
jgi:hypothetical protein